MILCKSLGEKVMFDNEIPGIKSSVSKYLLGVNELRILKSIENEYTNLKRNNGANAEHGRSLGILSLTYCI